MRITASERAQALQEYQSAGHLNPGEGDIETLVRFWRASQTCSAEPSSKPPMGTIIDARNRFNRHQSKSYQ